MIESFLQSQAMDGRGGVATSEEFSARRKAKGRSDQG
jgi:hypothetical protein